MVQTVLSLAAIAARFDRAAPTYDDSSMHRWLADQVARFAGSKPAEHILDVATGTGLAIEAVIDHECAAEFTGVDISDGMLAQASTKAFASRARLHHIDGTRLPFRNDTFDLTICVSAMPYFADPAAALTEWARVTRHGHLIFTAWAKDRLTLPTMVRQAAARVEITLPDPNSALGTEPAVRHVTTAAGLRVRRLITVEHQQPLQRSDVAAFDRIAASEFGAGLQRASPAARASALNTFRELRILALTNGEPNRSLSYIIETAEALPPSDPA